MAKQLIHVGVREFLEDMAKYLESSILVVITVHGQTVGYNVPARHGKTEEKELQALKLAVDHLATVLADHGISEDAVVSAFRACRAHG